MQYTVTRRGESGPKTRRPSPRTPVVKLERETFPAPVSRPGQTPRPGCWAARSRDGLWAYDRRDDHDAGNPWMVTYLPTGQQRGQGLDYYASLDAAREHTAGTLLVELVREAYQAAVDPADRDARGRGQRWLAVHMRLAGADESNAWCGCGGLLVATPAGLLHVDACAACHTPGRAGISTACPQADQHRFCPDPATV